MSTPSLWLLGWSSQVSEDSMGGVSYGVWGEGELVGCSGDPWKERVIASLAVWAMAMASDYNQAKKSFTT